MLSIDLNANELYSILDIKGLPQSTLNNSGFQDLIEIKSGKITSHSTVLAQYIISQQPPTTILQSMEVMNQHAERIFSADKKHAIRAAFITYSNLNLLILHHARNKFINCKILEYYYNLSQSRIYDDNPFFWLQYAIASMELPDYPRANSLLQKAYDCANQRSNFDTFQIDTQYARFILESACVEGSTSPYNDFIVASTYWDKAVKSSKSNPRLVICQVVKAYPEFFSKYHGVLSSEEKNKLLIDTQKFIDLAQQNNIFSRQHNRPSEIIGEDDLNTLGQLKKDILQSECVPVLL